MIPVRDSYILADDPMHSIPISRLERLFPRIFYERREFFIGIRYWLFWLGPCNEGHWDLTLFGWRIPLTKRKKKFYVEPTTDYHLQLGRVMFACVAQSFVAFSIGAELTIRHIIPWWIGAFSIAQLLVPLILSFRWVWHDASDTVIKN